MNNIETKVDEVFAKYMEEQYFAGGVCFVKQNDEDLLIKAYGNRNNVTNEEMTIDTIFDLASVTKIVTATIILMMITDKKLELEDTLGSKLSEVKGNKVLAPITIKRLLTHSSGLKAWEPFYTYASSKSFFSIVESIELEHKEEKAVIYSDLNYILLGEVIKAYFNDSLQGILKKELIAKLQLAQLTYGPLLNESVAATEFGNQIEMKMCHSRGRRFYNWRDTDKPILGEVNDGNAFYFFEGQSGHAGLFGTVEDLAKIAQVYLKGGIVGNKRLIDTQLIKQSMQNIVENRGLGWHSSDPFPIGFGHTGFTGTSVWVVPEKELQVTILTNRLHVQQPKNINPFRREIHEGILNTFF
jgi:CubicO group peptidase (beta-lactamase class C family)